MKRRPSTTAGTRKIIYCVGCGKDVDARLTSAKEIYPHRPDLAHIPFWKCDTCKNYVGTHWRSNTPFKPLGCIATPELLKARHTIHDILDPIWQDGRMSRGEVYRDIGEQLGYKYHTGEIRSMDEARRVYKIVAILHNLTLDKKRKMI